MNFADPVIMLKMGLDKASVQASEDQLVQSIRSAITKAEPQFEKIEAFLRTAFSKANPGAVLEASLSKALRGAAGGRFGDSYIAEFSRIEAAARSAGNAFLAASANAGKQLNLSAAGRLDVHPSWETSRIEAIQQKGYNAWRMAHIEEHSINEDRRLDQVYASSQRAYRAVERAGPDPQEAFANMLLGGPRSQNHPDDIQSQITARQQRYSADQRMQRMVERAGDPQGDFTSIDLGGRNDQVHQAQLIAERQARQQRYASYEAHQRLVERMGNPEEDLANMDLGGRIAQTHQDDITAERMFRQAANRQAYAQRQQQSYGAANLEHTLRQSDRDAHYLATTAQSRMEARSPEQQARYEAMPAFMQDRIDARQDRAASGRRWSSMHGHNVRFASQNVGFGIDDAIQSYHYGGIGASIRAASNNVTAIAGMTIANPAIAAATVVGLSVATAALPLVLRKMGYDENRLKAEATGAADASNVRLSYTGQTTGSLRRGGSVTSAYSAKAEEYFKATDQELANNVMRERAKAVIDMDGQGHQVGAKYSIHDENAMTYQRVLAEGRGRASYRGNNESERAAAGRREAVAFDEHLKWLKNDDATGGSRNEKIAVLKEQMEYIKNEAKTSFRRNEAQAVRDYHQTGSLYQADTIGGYESALKSKHAADSLALSKTDMMPHEVLRKQTELDLKLSEDLSHRHANTLTVASNVREREAFARNEAGAHLSDPVHSFYARQNAKRDQYAKMESDGTLTVSESSKLWKTFSQANDQQYQRDSRDYKANAYGGADALSQLRNIRDDRAEALSEGLKAHPQDFISYGRKLDQNQEGYKYQRETLMTSLTNQYKVTNSVGQVADHFAAEARKMEKMFADNPDLTKVEKDTLRTNLEKSFTLAKREAAAPLGTERFTSDAMAVGGMQDRELQARMLGSFVSSKEDDYKDQSLKDFAAMVTALGIIQEKLETARSGL